MKAKALLWAGLLLSGCADQGALTSTDEGAAIQTKDILINEIMPKGSALTNEFGDKADWIELYNNSGKTLTLHAGEWYLSDKPDEDPQKFELPEIQLAANEHLLVWCDGENVVSNDIHTNFKLSAKGETVVLYHKTGSHELQVVDLCSFGAAGDEGTSIARVEDGAAMWNQGAMPTPLAAN